MTAERRRLQPLSEDLMKHCKLSTLLAGHIGILLLILSAPLVSQAQTPVIDDATVNLTAGSLTLAGSNFSPSGAAPTVTLGGTSRTVSSFTNTSIVAAVPTTLAIGSYLVTVTNSVPQSASADVTVGAGTITLPFAGSAAGTSGSVIDITNTSPAHSAVAGHGAQAAFLQSPGGTGAAGYGGASNGFTSAYPSNGGNGLYAAGGVGTAEFDRGGAGIQAFGGNATGGGYGGNAVMAFGGTGAGGGGQGIYAEGGGSAEAGEFYGNVEVVGSLSKSGGSFKIDHPLDPANKYLYHSFVESPDMMNIYNGNVVTDGSGAAIVTMPAWFEALNTDFRYQLTVIGQFAEAIVASEIASGSFTIKTSKPGVKVSWQVTGVRQDAWANAHRIPVEVEKAQTDQGHYLHPELFGHQGEPSIAEIHHPRPPQQ
jgi:hypothetical protein